MNGKLITIAAMIVGLFVAIIMAVQVGQGEFKTVYITTLLIFSIPVLLILGLRSWYTLPFAMLAELPAVPLFAGRAVNMAELCVTMFTGLMVLAVMQGRQRLKIKFGDWWPMLIYGGWVLIIAVLNGGGFAILGSAAMGGRRYLTVMIALTGMVMLSQIKIGEKEAKRVSFLIFGSMALSGVYMAGSLLLGRGSYQGAYAFYSWQQGLSFVSIAGIFLLFARYKTSNIILNPWKAAVFILLLAIAAYSGKRMAFGACCVIPVVACLWHRQSIVALAAIMIGMLAIIGAVTVQNQIASIPQSLQRVLAFIPADWDWEVQQSTDNMFRDTLNRWAIKAVEERPLIGKGVTLTMDDFRLMGDKAYVSQIRGVDDDVQAFPHIAGKNWHSTWLGLSASFGIPCAIAWILVQIFVLKRSWELGHNQNIGIWCKTLMGMIFFFMVYGIIRSITSGDVAVLAMGGGLYLGLMSAVKNSLFDDPLIEENQIQNSPNESLNGSVA